jgi:hypothetical protein
MWNEAVGANLRDYPGICLEGLKKTMRHFREDSRSPVRYLIFGILYLGTRWGWVVSVTPRPRFSPGERTPGTHCTGGWVGPRAGLDTETRGKIILPRSGIEPRSPSRLVRSQTLYWLSYPAHFVFWRSHVQTSARRDTILTDFSWSFSVPPDIPEYYLKIGHYHFVTIPSY